MIAVVTNELMLTDACEHYVSGNAKNVHTIDMVPIPCINSEHILTLCKCKG